MSRLVNKPDIVTMSAEIEHSLAQWLSGYRAASSRSEEVYGVSFVDDQQVGSKDDLQ